MSSSDGWDDSSDDEMAPVEPSGPSYTIYNVPIPVIDSDKLDAMPSTITFSNVVVKDGRNYIYRCEPALKKYPGTTIPEHMRGCSAILTCMYVVNGISGPVRVRLPDFKGKDVPSIRRDDYPDCVFVEHLQLLKSHTLSYVKKGQDKKTGKDTAFYLGKGFLSHTGNIDPQFVIVMVPFERGRLNYTKACRTCKFYVHSKRQEKTHPRRNKRVKKNTELLQVETNIREAQITLGSLRQELFRVRHRNTKYVDMCRQIKKHVSSLPDGPVKISVEFATRNFGMDETDSIAL